AEALDRQVHSENGYHFRIKCSAAHGKLRFGRQVTGHSLAGAILIDTVRILAQIEEKDRNTIFFDDSVVSRTISLVRSSVAKEVVLKGSSRPRILHQYLGFESLSNVLAARERFKAVGFFRDDDDLVSVMTYLSSPHLDRVDFLAVVGELRELRIHRSNPTLAKAYQRLLESLFGPLDEDRARKLSATLALAKNLLTPDVFESTLRPLVEACLDVPERRVIANAIEAFSFFESISEDEVLAELMRSKDNRIAANAIVREGMRELSKDVVKTASGMLRANEPLHIASGLYAIGELAAYHRVKNPIYLETHASFSRLVSEIVVHIDHPDPMVRRQAEIAARKAQVA
ncbi:MAG: hypothetical protein AAB250_03615, partial [Bdellovibrionota bacterium]